jgi:hypothetical protein
MSRKQFIPEQIIGIKRHAEVVQAGDRRLTCDAAKLL